MALGKIGVALKKFRSSFKAIVFIQPSHSLIYTIRLNYFITEIINTNHEDIIF